MLKIENLTKKFHRRMVVERLNIHVQPGEMYCFLGPNGAGKTTTIKMITGLLRPDSGSIRIHGYDLIRDELNAKRSFGFVPDQPFLYDRLTPREFLRFIGGLYGMTPRECDLQIDEWLARFDLMDFQDELVGAFSHGMRQKIALAAGLIHEPPLLIIDEPMVGLDPKGAVIVKQILKTRCQQGMAAFVSTHSLEVAEVLADRIGIISNGRIIAEGTMEYLRAMVTNQHQRLEEIFLALTEADDIKSILVA